jgi:hypothetical protein
MLFLLAMEPLHMLFKKAQEFGLLSKLHHDYDSYKVSLYADDVALFIFPSASDLQVTNCVLQIFAEGNRLNTNLSKTEYYPIRCEETNLYFLTSSGNDISTFPTTYLGLPLGIKKPSKSTTQSLIQKVGNMLLGWARKFVTYPGCELLVKTVLIAMPVHLLTIFKMPKWAIAGVDKFRRRFF